MPARLPFQLASLAASSIAIRPSWSRSKRPRGTLQAGHSTPSGSIV
jgi:hypothetical protein